MYDLGHTHEHKDNMQYFIRTSLLGKASGVLIFVLPLTAQNVVPSDGVDGDTGGESGHLFKMILRPRATIHGIVRLVQ